MDSEAGKILVTLNRALTEKLRIKFRSVHALAKHDRPFTDYIWQCELDELKGVNVWQDYRSDKEMDMPACVGDIDHQAAYLKTRAQRSIGGRVEIRNSKPT